MPAKEANNLGQIGDDRSVKLAKYFDDKIISDKFPAAGMCDI